MGQEISAEERRKKTKLQLDELHKHLTTSPYVRECRDMSINRAILTFCGLGSSDNLKRHYEKRKVELGGYAQDWSKNLVEKLAGLSSVPDAAGLGALAVSIIIDLVFAAPAADSTADELRRVFAEEKASDVLDQVDECIKRMTMNINNRAELKSDIKRIERKLSEALTKLKNSIVRDGEVTLRAMNAWVNGAAFHIEMLIHLARMDGSGTCDPVDRLLSTYQSDLDAVVGRHKAFIQNKCCYNWTPVTEYTSTRVFRDKETGFKYDLLSYDLFPSFEEVFEVYYNYRFSDQKREIQQHFAEVKENLSRRIGERGSFSP